MTDNQPSCPICKGEVEKMGGERVFCENRRHVGTDKYCSYIVNTELHKPLSQLRVDKDEAVDLLKQIQEQIPSILEKFSKAERMLNEISKP